MQYVFVIVHVQQFFIILGGQQLFGMVGAFNTLIAQHSFGVLAAERVYGILGAPVFGVFGSMGLDVLGGQQQLLNMLSAQYFFDSFGVWSCSASCTEDPSCCP